MSASTGRRINSQHSRASFVPIDPDIDVDQLIRDNPNFAALPRVDARALNDNETLRGLEALIQQKVIEEGMPLVIENWHLRTDWPSWMFNDKWLMENHGRDGEWELWLLLLAAILADEMYWSLWSCC